MDKFFCTNGCCTISVKPYLHSNNFFHRRNNRKAGVFIYDSNSNKVLLVQSKGNLWGPPKGSVDNSETLEQCAIREVKEETGLDIHVSTDFFTQIHNATYYYLDMKECYVDVQDTLNNDANGITWIKKDCLRKYIDTGKMTITKHCDKIIFGENFLYPK